MTLLQLQIDDNLKSAIQKKAKGYGVPSSSLIRIVLVESFIEKDYNPKIGNVFNADRDNKGKGIKIDDLIESLPVSQINAGSPSFDFLKDEPDIYSLNDLKKQYYV